MIQYPSENFDDRPEGQIIDILVLHYTGMKTGKAALERLRDSKSMVSAHYVIDEEGEVYQLVEEEDRAWHAGVSSWRGQKDINNRSIGIELVNPGHEFGYVDFPRKQIKSLITLITDIYSRHPIPARNVVAHPGEKFPWDRLAKAGFGLWPFKDRGTLEGGACPLPLSEVQDMLRLYGYEVSHSAEMDEPTTLALKAFQRHFRPALVDGNPDRETVVRLSWMVMEAMADKIARLAGPEILEMG